MLVEKEVTSDSSHVNSVVARLMMGGLSELEVGEQPGVRA